MKTNQTKPKDFVTIPIDTEMKIALRTMAGSKNQTMSQFIRDIIAAAVKSQQQSAGVGR